MVQKKIKKFFNSVTIHERMPVLYQKPKTFTPHLPLIGICAAALLFGVTACLLMQNKSETD